MNATLRRSALAFAVLSTPLLGLAQDSGGAGASQAAPAAAAAAVKETRKALKIKPVKEDASLKRERIRLEKLARREKRGERLREKGEALGGGKGQQLLADGEKKEVQDDKDKKPGLQRLAESN
ncbi:MAG: hypothetical protein NTX64_01275 [Elusimicrobia bacterium]|nr:hypothetical protein [Elusimicrobiota bacterium]